MHKAGFIGLLYFICIYYCKAQSGLKFISAIDGLSQNTVTCLLQTSDGFLWIGTQDGLNRYDGLEIKSYFHEPEDSNSLTDSYITCLYESDNHDIWIGTRNGINRLNKATGNIDRFYLDPYSKTVFQNQTGFINSSSDSNLIILAGQQLFKFHPQTGKSSLLANKIIDYNNLCVVDGNAWQVWDSVHACLVSNKPMHSHEKWKRKTGTQNLSDMVFSDTRGNIWYVQNNRNQTAISIFNTYSSSWLRIKWKLNALVAHISFGKNNQPWIATSNGIYTIKKDSLLMRGPSLNQHVKNQLLTSLELSNGLLWMGTADRGLAMYNPSSEAFSQLISSSENPSIYAALALFKGNKYLTAGSNGVEFIKNNFQKATLSKLNTRALIQTDKNSFWIGSSFKGIQCIDLTGKLLTVYNQENGSLPGNELFHLNFDTMGNKVFAASTSGLAAYNLTEKKWTIINSIHDSSTYNKLTGTYVLSTFTDYKGNTWVATNQGVDVLDSQLNRIFWLSSKTDTSSLKSTIVTQITSDQKGRYWISTLSRGIYKLENNNLKNFSTKNGLSSNVCYGLATDSLNRIWIASSKGVNLMDPETGQIQVIAREDGIRPTDFAIGTVTKQKDGFIHFGSSEGLIIAKPELHQFRSQPLKVIVTEVKVDVETLQASSNMILPPDNKMITVGFVAPAFVTHSSVVYQYRWKEINPEWILVKNNDRQTSFSNLPYSALTLEIRAAYDQHLLASSPITRLVFIREKPFWLKTYFVVSIIIIFTLLLFLLGRWIEKNKTRKKLREVELEQSLSKERERISRDLHDSLGAYAAAIKSNLYQIEKNNPDTSSLFVQLKSNADEMVKSLRESIWALKNQSLSLTALSDRFKVRISRMMDNYPGVYINLKERIEKNLHFSPSEGLHLIRIMEEALTNSLKHANASSINIYISTVEGMDITITDNGKGFSMDRTTMGNGLLNMKERAAETGLLLSIISCETGTTVNIKKNLQANSIKTPAGFIS